MPTGKRWMTYKDRAEKIRAISGITTPYKDVVAILRVYDKIISEHVASGELYDIPGVGKLETVVLKARRYWHIKHKEHRYGTPNIKMKFTCYEKQRKRLKKRRWTRVNEVNTSHPLPEVA